MKKIYNQEHILKAQSLTIFTKLFFKIKFDFSRDHPAMLQNSRTKLHYLQYWSNLRKSLQEALYTMQKVLVQFCFNCVQFS